jgi:cold shock CspA family protein
MTGPLFLDGRLDGTVTAFDEARALGVVTTADGTAYPFHSVSIADGSRTIDVGAPVSFAVLLKLGRREAADIRAR